jgi:hypothetical protein
MPTPIPCCGSLAVATFTTTCQYDSTNHWTNIDSQADLVNNCTRPVTADVTFYLQVTEDDPPTGGWVCWDQVTLPGQQFPGGTTTTLLDTWAREQIPPRYYYYRLLIRIESPDLCQTLDTYSAPDGLCTPTGAQVPEHTTCIIPPPPEPTSTPTPTHAPTCAPTPYWCTSSSPNINPWSNELHGVAAITTDDIWAVGSHDLAIGTESLVQHWNGSAWNLLTVPSVGGLRAVAKVQTVVPTPELWAVGENGVLHYTNAAWTANTNVTGMNGVVARNPTDVWVVGSNIQHWAGSWSTPVAANGTLNSVASVADNNAWAVGFTGTAPNRRPLIKHWNGTQWVNETHVPTFTTDAFLNGIDRYNATNIWAVGAYADAAGLYCAPILGHQNQDFK